MAAFSTDRYFKQAPKKRFGAKFLISLPLWLAPSWATPDDEQAPEGYSLAQIQGRPMVIYRSPGDRGVLTWARRPIVRVPMGRRVSPSTVDRETVRKFQRRYLRALAAGAGGWAGP